LPEIQRLAQTLRPRGLELITVMLDGNQRAGRAVADRIHLYAPILVGDDELRLKMSVNAYPWTLILDRTGKPVHAIRGARSAAEFRKQFEQRL
jgi:hypothetical protein